MQLGYVYFLQIGDTGAVKIGFSYDPYKRAKMLQTAHPEDLHLLGAIRGDEVDEKFLHHFFEQFHIRGEWFEPGDDLLTFAREYAIDLPPPRKRLRKPPDHTWSQWHRAKRMRAIP